MCGHSIASYSSPRHSFDRQAPDTSLQSVQLRIWYGKPAKPDVLLSKYQMIVMTLLRYYPLISAEITDYGLCAHDDEVVADFCHDRNIELTTHHEAKVSAEWQV